MNFAKLMSIYQKLSEEQQKGNCLISALSCGSLNLETPVLRGENIFPKMKRLIESAESEVLFMGYKIESGSDGEQDFLEALKTLSKKAQDNNKTIDVKILINQKTGLAEYFKPTKTNTFFNTVNDPINALDYKNLNICYQEHLHQAFGSYHGKALIVDEKEAMVLSGDLSLGNNYKDNTSRYLDVASIITGGTLLGDLRNEFVRAWNSNHCKPRIGEKEAMQFSEIKSNDDIRKSEGTNQTIFISKKANGTLSKRDNLSPYAIALIHAIENAEKSISIIMPNLNEDKIIIALADACVRGVKVNITMSKRMNEQSELKPFMGGSNQQGIQKLCDNILQKKGI